jgi:ribonuclease HI
MQEKMIIFTDGGSRGNPGRAGAGVFITDQAGQEIYRQYSFLGLKTNNEAEYLALNLALKYLQTTLRKPTALVFKLDSKLVVEQMNKNWKIKESRLQKMAEENWKLLSLLPCSTCEIKYIPRSENSMADMLANKAMDSARL